MNVKAMLSKNFEYSTHISSLLVPLRLTKPDDFFKLGYYGAKYNQK